MSSRKSARDGRFRQGRRALKTDMPALRPDRILSRTTLLVSTSALALVLAATHGAVARPLGGGAFVPAPNMAAAAAAAAAQQANTIGQQSRSALARATQAIQAMQATQAAARAAAQVRQTSTTAPVYVPNGLAPGGLVPDSGLAGNGVANPVTTWVGANTPTQSTGADGRTNVGILQTQAQAILNWNSFNIGANTTLTFNQQGNANWVALNRVNASTAPSQILGAMKADGQVYVINPNGIIFGGGSQINVGSLIASTAGITNDQFLSHGIYSTQSGSLYIPSFTGAAGKIIVEAGADIETNAPASVTSGGGFVLLMGTEVDNAGQISTPGGQTMLAAGDDFILRPGFGTDANQSSTTRGNEIATGTWTPGGSSGTWVAGGGTVDNTGLIFSQQGDITLAGHAIIQDGILLSTTSVNQRGTIHLLNSASDGSGSVTLTGNSISLILPETDSTDTALDSQRDALIAASTAADLLRAGAASGQFDDLSTLADREDQSRVEIVTGGTVDFQPGSLTMAQGGQVAASAGVRVFAETGATIDVSGVQGVVLPMSANDIEVNIQGNELRDSPDNRDSGNLLNANVWVDVRDLILVPAGTGGDATDRYYTPGGLLEVSGYLGNTAHTIGEWTAVGGSITLSAPEVVAQQGSTFNISGGTVQYQGGYLNQTYLLGSDGRVYNVNDAPSYLTYVGVASGFVVTHEQGGQIDNSLTQIYASPFHKGAVYEAGYTVGRDAGTLILSTPTAVFAGDIVADVFTGDRQTNTRPAGVTDGYTLPQDVAPLAGRLALGQYNATGLTGGYATTVVFGSNPSTDPSTIRLSDPLPSSVANTAYFDAPGLNNDHLGGVSIATQGSIDVDAPLTFAPGAQVKLVAPTIDIKADITAPSGSVTVTNIVQPDAAGQAAFTVTTPDGTSQLTLESGATIDVGGLWINQLSDPNGANELAFLNGGNVTFDSTQNVTLAAGSTIDVSSGGAILANGKTQGGRGGNVTLTAGDPFGSLTAPATLTLNGTIRAYGVNGGGTLTVNDPGTILIGSNAILAGGVLGAGTPAPIAVTLSQDMTIPAGQPLPAMLSESFTSLPPGVVAPVDVSPGAPSNLVTQAPWVVPKGMVIVFVGANFTPFTEGQTVPAGSEITSFGPTSKILAGTSIPVNVFPNGIPVQPFHVFLAAGSIETTPTTYPAGTTIPAGTVLPQTVAVQAAPALNPAFFDAGFTNYVIDGDANVLVSDGTAVAPTMPVYQFTAASYSAPSGSDPAAALSLWLPPLFTENPVNGTLTQRGGASLTLRSTTTKLGVASGGTVTIGDGASVTVDPGQSIELDAFGQLTVDGSLTAHGGNITLNGGGGINYDPTSGTPLGISTWIGGDARLDVSGEAYTALDLDARPYGLVTDGGSIAINGATSFVVIRPGAELDADGAAATIDLAAGMAPRTPSQMVTVPSNGGSISLGSSSGIYNDGNLHAFAGGAGAAGGSLSISLDTPDYTVPSSGNGGTQVPGSKLTPGIMTVMQQADSGLPSDIAPGADVSSLVVGRATVSADAIHAGGFDTVSLFSRDFLVFSGDVSLKVGQSLTLSAGAFASGTPVPTAPNSSSAPITGAVTLAAPYVLLTSPSVLPNNTGITGTIGQPANLASNPTNATFEIDADQIDVQGQNVFGAEVFNPDFPGFSPGFKTITLKSQGDIRFLAPDADQGSMTWLRTAWDLNLVAAQIYPGTSALAVVVAGDNPQQVGTLTISRSNDSDPGVPSSIFGQLFLNAPTIEQGGILRAPFGTIALGNSHGQSPVTTQVLDLLPGSITSVSADGLIIPYGGTTDGVTWNYNGATVSPVTLGINAGAGGIGLTLDSVSINVHDGAVVDVSGGGAITGAGFISGRGGSVNVLTTPLVNANPTTPVSRAGDKVYAIVPGYASAYAPIAGEHGAGDPVIGQQITIPAGVPGLPAGTYTLLPSTYALLPGAFRVEIGATSTQVMGPASIGNGTYVTAGYTGIANSGIKSALPSVLLISPGSAVRADSQYDEQSYSDFMIANAALVGSPRPLLPIDANNLNIALELPSQPVAGPALTFDGVALMQGAAGGYNGTLAVTALQFTSQGPAIEIYNDAPTPGFSGVSIAAQALDAIAAPRLIIGGSLSQTLQNNTIPSGILSVGGGASGIFIRSGVDLEAGEIFIGASGTIDIGAGAKLDTVGQGAAPYDSTNGYVYQASSTLLALSNGTLDFIGSSKGSGAITIEAGAQVFSEGTLVFATNGPSTIDPSAQFGSRNLSLAVGTLNIGDSAAIAAAGAPSGVLFNQDLFNLLVNGDPSHGAPALQTLTLAAASAINLFGSASLDATGSGIDLVLTTPAIYGYGTAADQATISAGKITWNSIAGATPPAIGTGGAGTGFGTLNLEASEIDLGQFVALDKTSASRTIYGFSNVNLVASSQIVSAGNSALFVYQAPSTTAGDVFGQSGTGGNLNISTPLLTGVQQSVMAYTTGGALSVTAPAGAAPSTATSTVAGAEIDLNADNVTIASTILLPSGKLVVNATNDITLDAGSRIDVSGQPSMIQDATVYGFGGTVSLNSVQGGVTQAAGALIDVSATNANAGSINIEAGSGTVSLDGALKGSATDGFTSGDFSVTAGTLVDFAGLNARLTDGGVFDARSFDIKTGDLTIGDGVKAHNVEVSVDDGSLTVTGTIDASGASPGTIRLAAKDDLTIASSGVLDAHGNTLQVDSYGQPIEAKNAGYIELAATQGTLTLAPGATMNLSTPDGVAYGEIELNAARGTIGTAQSAADETSGDVRINASGPLNITGAQSIAVNGFWTYIPTDQYGTIVQDNGEGANGSPVAANGYLGMDQVDARSQTFIDNALGNQNLLGRLAGLSAYTDAFHLRPGIEIDSSTPNGTLTVAGDIDLSGFRYNSLNPLFPKTGIYGSGEPGALVIRAGGNLDIVGSISDGFMPAPATPDDNGWVLQAGVQKSSIETLLPVAVNSGTTFPNTAGLSLRYAIPINAATISAGAVIPTQVTLSGSVTLPAGTRLTAAIHEPDGTTLNAGTVLTAATVLPMGTQLDAGSVMPSAVGITAMTWPAGANLGVFTGAVTLGSGITVPFEGIIPSGANVQLTDATEPTRPTGASGTQGSFDAIAAMLPQGELSWSERLVSGADLTAADTRIVKSPSALKALGVSGNLTLVDGHYGSISMEYFYYYYPDGRKFDHKYSGSPSNNFYCVNGPGYCGTPFAVAGLSAITNPSVVRTGTGNLDLIAGGSFSEDSLFGVYTAGTQSAPQLVNGSNPFNQPRGLQDDGTLLGAINADQAAVVAATYQAWYPEHGGNVLVSAQGDLTGDIAPSVSTGNVVDPNNRFVDSDAIGNWLWRQGGGGLASDPTAWWINFGTYAHASTTPGSTDASFLGFQGIGTLGGGNLTVIAGGNAGLLNATASTGLDLAVASTGRILPDGTLIQTGGGDLTVKIGGTLNPVNPNTATNLTPDALGSITDLRGNITIEAGAVGAIAANLFSDGFSSIDPRPLPPGTTKQALMTAGPIVTPGDGTVSIATRGDLAFGGAGDAGFVQQLNVNGTSFTLINPDGSTTFVPGGGTSSFTLWTPATSIALYSAGGDVAPLTAAFPQNISPQNGIGLYPGTLIVAAANGDVRFQDAFNISRGTNTLELLPSPIGQLELLAAGTIYGADQVLGMSGADMSSLATPFHPLFLGAGLTNASPTSSAANGGFQNPIAFGQDTPSSDLHAGDNQPILIYAGLDIDDLTIGRIQNEAPFLNFQPTLNTWYLAAKPVQMIAGRDIVGRGLTPDVFFNDDANDISLVQAGRDIFFQSVTIAGPGLLEVQAGRNLYQTFQGQLVSVGGQIGAARTSQTAGAGISVLAGVGANGPNYADFAKLYFDPANQLPAGTPLEGSGKVVQTYDQELLTWLRQRYGYTGNAADALAFFLALPSLEQGIFVRQVYYEELTLSGREETGAIMSPRVGSYLRGREAIAALFPTEDANSNPITYSGGITMFSTAAGKNGFGQPITNDSDIYTQRGGDIQILNPGGQTIIGVEGVAPGPNAGLITGGLNAAIDIYSEGSVLLGQSRIMTQFGGDILAWSADGDINAGRGSKTTTIFVPPVQIYDNYGDITLSPPTTASGAGIAALEPLAGVAPGNVDLIAPLGTIDAGEAGIRVSGNVNLAALQVLNAANIQVQGTATGVPTVPPPPTAALASASNAAAAATKQAMSPAQTNSNGGQPSVIIVEVLGYGGGDGSPPAAAPQQDDDCAQPQMNDCKPRKGGDRQSYDPNGAVQVLGYAGLSDAQTIGLTQDEAVAIKN